MNEAERLAWLAMAEACDSGELFGLCTRVFSVTLGCKPLATAMQSTLATHGMGLQGYRWPFTREGMAARRDFCLDRAKELENVAMDTIVVPETPTVSTL